MDEPDITKHCAPQFGTRESPSSCEALGDCNYLELSEFVKKGRQTLFSSYAFFTVDRQGRLIWLLLITGSYMIGHPAETNAYLSTDPSLYFQIY